MLLYLTADHIGGPGGGATVTHHESEALKSLGPCEVWGRDRLEDIPLYHNGKDLGGSEPWRWDNRGNHHFTQYVLDGIHAGVKADERYPVFQLAHLYAGTFTRTVGFLKRLGCKVVYTAAAHSIEVSRREHEALGLPYWYPHMSDPEQFRRYVGGYLAADVLVCPSRHSADVMRGYGATNRIEIIPHGCELPKCKPCRGTGHMELGWINPEHAGCRFPCEKCSATGNAPIAPLPKRFTVGYLGCCAGPDKGVRYLLAAWKKLAYRDATLVLAGKDSTSPWVRMLYDKFGGGNVHFAGWQRDVGEFYDGISLLVQPSCSEGFGIEVLEAMAHGRPVVCSTGAGAADVAFPHLTFEPGNVDELADLIDFCKKGEAETSAAHARGKAAKYTWDIVRQRYVDLWRSL